MQHRDFSTSELTCVVIEWGV